MISMLEIVGALLPVELMPSAVFGAAFSGAIDLLVIVDLIVGAKSALAAGGLSSSFDGCRGLIGDIGFM